jgi:hypothetical protein
VAIFVDSTDKFCESVMNNNNPTPKEEKKKPSRKNSKKKVKGLRASKQESKNKTSMFLGYLNVGSNFNHLSSILSQQSIMSFKAVGSNT